MSTKQVQDIVQKTNFRKDPADWVTGDDKASPGQLSFLTTLASEVGQRILPEELAKVTKAQASGLIQEFLKKRQELQGVPSPSQPLQPPKVVSLNKPKEEKDGEGEKINPSDVEAWMNSTDA